MKPLKPFRQSTGLCGPASLKILLSHYGKDFTEDELAALCHATVKAGTNHADMIAALEHLGESPVAKSGATVEELRSSIEREVPVIVGWWSDDDDHFSIIYAMDDETVSMMDPEWEEGSRQMNIKKFEKVWYDFDGPDNHRVDRWMLTLPKKSV